MDATTFPDREHASRNLERATPFLHLSPASVTVAAEVSVMILYADPVIAAGLAAVLGKSGGFVIAPAPEPGAIVWVPLAADVVLADYDAAMRLAQSAQQWAKKLVVFTHHDSEAKICRALESGASGYLLHGASVAELIEGIRSVCDGGVALSPLVAARITNRFQGRTLTPRESAVLEQLMLGLSNKAIARQLNLGVGTVKTYVKAILQKLEADSRTAAVIAAQRRGLLP